MGRAVIIGTAVAIVIIVVAVVATLFLTHPLTPPRPSTTYVTINAPYAFLKPTGSGLFELFYYDSQGNLHDLEHSTYKAAHWIKQST